MAAIVAANGDLGSSAISSQEKCSRNKRKFPADSPVLDTPDPSLMESAYHDYETISAEPLSSQELEKHVSLCSTCRALTHSLKEVLDLEDVRETDWSGMTETQLEELLLSNLDAAYKNAIKKITSYGYTESIAINALLNVGHCYGCKDPVASIAEHALEYLASGKAVDVSESENASEQIRKLEKTLLEDMVSVLMEMRPFISRGNAMWSLLMCDMNLSIACMMDTDTFSSSGYSGISGSSAVQLNSNCNSYGPSSLMSECNAPAGELNSSTHPPLSFSNETSSLASVPGLPSSRFYASGSVHGPYSHSEPLEENPLTSSKSLEENLFSHALPRSSLPREKPTGSKKRLASSSRDRCRSNQSDRNSRLHGYRSGSRSTKTSNLASVLLDKKNKSVSGFISNPKSSPQKLDKTIELASSESITTQTFSFTAGSSNIVSTGLDTVNKNPSLPPASIDASLLFRLVQTGHL
ncbi:putative E3 ubiquitin-protein ligase RF298 [Zingiber officinale]|uniref:putative E3 ubiquitin-protein ligase RF298 n=1 Tax=Zingiber officinale TaxID=94328 RepID=UPI001C4D29A0|nr:putative E3 ubiquitin-protein ligase RF298 [Zingiber officinale]